MSRHARPADLRGRRVLVVEDEAIVAMLVVDLLNELGCQVLGPAACVDQALQLAADEAPDAAVLDVNLGGEKVYPVAAALQTSKVPYVFVTGYGVAGLHDAYKACPTIQKPFRTDTFGDALLAGFAAWRTAP